METVDRKALTENDIKRDILKKFGYKALAHFGSFIGFFAGVTFFGYFVITFFNTYVSEHNNMAGLGAIVFGAMLAYILFGVGYHLFKLFTFAAKTLIVLKSGFRIVEDTLVNSDLREYNALKRYATFVKSRRHQYTDGYEEVMYFHKYGREVLCVPDSYSDDYGEKFYLAVYGRKNEIAKSYCANKYEIIK